MSIVINPVTRIEGHLSVELTIENLGGHDQITEARVSGELYRGFENILAGKPPQDAVHLTQRICGACPVSHGLAASKTVERSAGVTAPNNARLLRNLILGANFLHNHILHFYFLTLFDYAQGPASTPWSGGWGDDPRLSSMVDNLKKALTAKRTAHAMGAILGGRFPHPASFLPGGFTTDVTAQRIQEFQSRLSTVQTFINTTYLPDVQRLAELYSEEFSLGQGHGHLLAAGGFDESEGLFFSGGYLLAGAQEVKTFYSGSILESVVHSHYADAKPTPPRSGKTETAWNKDGAYSWIKAPRYGGWAFETGPIARMTIAKGYKGGVSVMDRHMARALEASLLAAKMQQWLGELEVGGAVWNEFQAPEAARTYALVEAPRGVLGHWLELQDTAISHYQIVTPTCWNASPRDEAGIRGAMEQALIGTAIADQSRPVEAMRIVHSFDPCLACSVH